MTMLSLCCQSPVEVSGNVTKHYVCTKCGKAADALHLTGHRAIFLPHIYREVDGYFYYDAHPDGGSYSAHILREIADMLDEMNKPWNAIVEAELGKCACSGGQCG